MSWHSPAKMKSRDSLVDYTYAFFRSKYRCVLSIRWPFTKMLFKQFVSMLLELLLVCGECETRFLAKKFMDLINLRIISRFFFFHSSACLAAPAHCISIAFFCSTCLAILTVIDESWCHLDPLCCFSSSVAWFQSTIPLVVHPPLGGSLPHFFRKYKTCQLRDLHTEPKDELSPKLSCSLGFSCNISSSVEQIFIRDGAGHECLALVCTTE